MKILLVADRIHKALYDYFQKERWEDIDLILSAGDLRAGYLSFLVTVIRGAPLYYVRGNHDKGYEENPPLGCVDIHGKIINHQELNIMGLEGSRWYGGRGIEYTEGQMKWQLIKMWPRLYFKDKIDIILTHTPPLDLNDGEGDAHKGFKVFRDLIDRLQPRYFIHGHVHLCYGRRSRITEYKKTTIVNAYQYHVLEVQEG